MLKDNLCMLRNLHGFSQECLAEKIGVSRQAYAKWENGITVPDIEKCLAIANIYGVTLDRLAGADNIKNGIGILTPKGKNIHGSVTVNDRGQIVIPKDARDKFSICGGKRLIVLSDDEGIALISAEKFEEHIQEMLSLASAENDS